MVTLLSSVTRTAALMTTAAMVVTIGACTPRPNGPEPVVEEFFAALATGDTATAAELADQPEEARAA
ncbi:penicillin-binding protein, partial [Mycobacterium sp. ITM-2017-0098]